MRNNKMLFNHKSSRVMFCLFAVLTLVLITGSGVSAGEEKKEEEKLVGKTVNVNTATAEEFVKNVPLITPELAKKIVEYRNEAGDFMTIEELLQVDGFDRELLRRVKKFLLLEGIGGTECTC